MKKSVKKFTLVEIMIVVAIIAVLGAIAMPHFGKSREGALKRQALEYAQMVTAAKEMWAMDYGKTSADTPLFSEIQPYMPNIKTLSDLNLSDGSVITINAYGTDPTYPCLQ